MDAKKIRHFAQQHVEQVGQPFGLKPCALAGQAGAHLRLVERGRAAPSPEAPISLNDQRPAPAKATEPEIGLLAGSMRYGAAEKPFYAIGLDKGRPWDVDLITGEFRIGFPGLAGPRTGEEWLRVWERFVVRHAERQRGWN